MGRIAEQAERAGKVIKSVHDFVRRREQAREAVEPHALLDAVMPLVALQARKLSVALVLEVDAACPPVLCDRTMVEQVLLNLSRNGMQAMQQLGRSLPRVLTLRVQPAPSDEPGCWITFSVIDGGEGISPDVESQLFTPFFTTKVEGMGLGLSLCRTVIEQHGGFLAFEPARRLPRRIRASAGLRGRDVCAPGAVEHQSHLGAFAEGAFSPDTTAVSFDDVFGDGEAEASAALAAGAVDFIETLEDTWQLFLGNAAAGVTDSEGDVFGG